MGFFSLGMKLGAAPGGPALSLDFLTTTTLDPRITFTRASTAMRGNASGVLESVAIDAPRFEYHPITLAARGLLIEEARTNLIDYSSDLTNAAYSKVGAPTITADAIAAPDGAVSADLLTRTTNAATYVINDTPKAGTAQQFTASLFNKASVGAYTTLRQQGTYPAFAEARFNNAAAAISTAAYTSGTFAAASATVTPFPGGWQRNTLTATTDTKIADTLFTTVNSNNGATDAADSVSNSAAYYWGVQLEQGEFATSPIPTTAAAVTRAADSAVMTGANFSDWWNTAAGTVVVEATSPASGTRIVWQADDGTANNRVTIWTDGVNAKATIVAGGGTQADLALGAITANTAFKVALAFAANDVAGSLNGAAVVTDASTTLPVVDRCRLGSDTVGNQLCGYIRTTQGYAQRLPNATIVTLST